jgi:hypothetical protein
MWKMAFDNFAYLTNKMAARTVVKAMIHRLKLLHWFMFL